MRRLLFIAAVAAGAAVSPATAQTWGQPYHRAPTVTWGQPHGGWGAGLTEWDGRAYAATGHAATGYVQGPAPAYGGHVYGAHSYGGGSYGDPRAYRPPNGHGFGHSYGHGYGGHDRGGRYGYSGGNRWTRWSSPPGRGYHDAYGYNDDRAPRGPDHGRRYGPDCDCGVGPYLYDR